MILRTCIRLRHGIRKTEKFERNGKQLYYVERALPVLVARVYELASVLSYRERLCTDTAESKYIYSNLENKYMVIAHAIDENNHFRHLDQ